LNGKSDKYDGFLMDALITAGARGAGNPWRIEGVALYSNEPNFSASSPKGAAAPISPASLSAASFRVHRATIGRIQIALLARRSDPQAAVCLPNRRLVS
jgi:hypothetical protein